MAHLMSRSGTHDARGQLFIIGAIALAITFVALTLLLNTAIYTENMAARGENVGGTDVHKFVSESSEHLYTTFSLVEGKMYDSGCDVVEDSAYEDRSQRFECLVESLESTVHHGWGPMVGERYGAQGILANIRLADDSADEYPTEYQIRNGYYIEQHPEGGEYRDFTVSGLPNDNWALLDTPDASVGIRDFKLYIAPDEDPMVEQGGSEPFAIELRAGSDTNYDIEVYREFGDTIEVAVVDVTNGVEVGTCSGSYPDDTSPYDDTVTIDVTGSMVGGAYCEPLGEIFPVVGNDFEVRFDNPTQAHGAWEVVVPDVTDLPGRFDAQTNFESSSKHDIYETIYYAQFRVSYSDGRDAYVNRMRLAPGEHELDPDMGGGS